MNNNSKEIKQIVILSIVVVVIIIFSAVMNVIMNKEETKGIEETEETTIIEESESYTINGKTKSEWEEQVDQTDVDVYNKVMELFETGLTEDIEIDWEAISDDSNQEEALTEEEAQSIMDDFYAANEALNKE